MAKRLDCDAIFLARESVLGKPGDTISSRAACEIYAQKRRFVSKNEGTHEALARWSFLAVYFGVSPILFLDISRISVIDQYLLGATTCAVLYSGWQVWIHSRAIKQKLPPRITDPVAGIEALFDSGVVQRRWIHRKDKQAVSEH